MIKKIFLPTLILCLFDTAFAQMDVASHPAWSAKSNIYEVNVRQYTPAGTFKAFEKNLPRLKNMGVEIIWFMPITPIGLEGRKMTTADLGSYYAVKDYKAVNPEFGTMDDFKDVVKFAHALGLKVITDWVPNHSAPDNHWIKNHPNFYVKDTNGEFVAPYDWTDTRKLNYADRELRDTMIEAMKFWLKETNIDGFRCDVAGDVPTDFWKQCITELKKIKNVFMLAEAEKPELHTAGFDETYGWGVMQTLSDVYTGKKTVGQFDSLINHNILVFPSDAYRMYFTTNHDWNSWEGTEFEKFGDASKTAAIFSQTMFQSIPLIYSGQEIPNTKRIKFFVKDPIDWTGKLEMAAFYSKLLHLRKSNPALAADASYKKLVTANDVAIFAYIREKDNHKVAVILNLSKHPQSFTIGDPMIQGKVTNVFSGKKETLSRYHVYQMKAWGFLLYEYE